MAESTGFVLANGSPQHPLAQMYAHRILDPAVELAHAVSADFLAHPVRYQDPPEDVATLLSRFHGLAGSHPEWLSGSQRAAISNGTFAPLSGDMANLRRAGIAFCERGSGHGEDILRRAFLDAASSLRSTARWTQGRALELSATQIESVFSAAERILKCEEITRAFGIPVLPPGTWPDGGLYSPEAAYLCENISTRLAGRRGSTSVTQAKFSILQRVAHYGAMTLSHVMDSSTKEGDRLTELIAVTYGWASALQNLLARIHIVRGWTDADYRTQLLAAERDILPPNPAGDFRAMFFPGPAAPHMGLGGAEVFSDQTYTVSGEVCCSSGECNGESNTDDCETQTADCTGDCPTAVCN